MFRSVRGYHSCTTTENAAFNAGLLLEHAGQNDEARTAFEQAIDPNNPVVLPAPSRTSPACSYAPRTRTPPTPCWTTGATPTTPISPQPWPTRSRNSDPAHPHCEAADRALLTSRCGRSVQVVVASCRRARGRAVPGREVGACPHVRPVGADELVPLILGEIALGQHAGVLSRTVRSKLAEAIVFPSGLNATLVTVSVWPVKGWPTWRPVAASHSRTV